MLKLRNQYFILRHGQTIFQTKKKGFIYPWPEKNPICLTEKGEEQIKLAAQKIKKEKIEAIYSSDIPRTRQTAKVVAKELGLKINFDKRLRDINLGIYRGKTIKEFRHDFPCYLTGFCQRAKRGESWNDVKKRLMVFIKEIDKKYRNKNILIISHGDPLWLFEGVVKNWSIDKLLKIRETNYIKTGEFKKFLNNFHGFSKN